MVAALGATIVGPRWIGAEPDRSQVSVALRQPAYDGYQSLLDDEAHAALAAGSYRRAWQLFWRLLTIDHDDLRALRESGRIASALGQFSYAVDALGRVDELDGASPDGELHYLRGEALTALGRTAEAEVEFTRMARDLGDGPYDRRATLWIARVAVLHGDLAGALRGYESLLRDDDPSTATYAETVLYEAEAYTLCGRWASAERILRAFLREQPTHDRARALLAWVLEGQRKIDEEVALRAELADEWTEHPRKTLDYARALERAHEDAAALARYREAHALGVDGATEGIERLAFRRTPEVGAGVSMGSDPSGTIEGWRAGATVELGRRLRVAVTAQDERTSGGLGGAERTLPTASAWALLATHRGGEVAAGVTLRLDDVGRGVGASARLRTSPDHTLQLQARGDFNLPWDESASSLREGGEVDVASAQLYATPRSSRVLFSVGVQARRLGLAPRAGLPAVHARQLLAAAGLDVMLTSEPRQLRGDSLDPQMLDSRSLTTSTVISYRHYEMTSDDPFGARLVLVERSSVDELSGSTRRVFGANDSVGAELRAGLGYDWVRSTRQWRVGASLLLAVTVGTRLSLDYDVASESATGLSGRRQVGSVVLHVDL